MANPLECPLHLIRCHRTVVTWTSEMHASRHTPSFNFALYSGILVNSDSICMLGLLFAARAHRLHRRQVLAECSSILHPRLTSMRVCQFSVRVRLASRAGVREHRSTTASTTFQKKHQRARHAGRPRRVPSLRSHRRSTKFITDRSWSSAARAIIQDGHRYLRAARLD